MEDKGLRASDGGTTTVLGEPAPRVLVVDDNALIRRLVVELLRRVGYAVLEAGDGAEALACFRRNPAQVVITDIGMPRVGGLELLAALRQHEARPEVILLTGSHASDAEAAVQALRLGAHDYIVKDPTAGEALTLAVERAAEKWRLRDENARLLLELQRLSLTDGLTGVGNRRAFDQALRQEVARAHRHGLRLCLAIVDLDHFKRVNDKHGHSAGDAVLVSFARRLCSVARDSDRLFRYGGEEFAILLTDTEERGGASFARRVVESTAAEALAAGSLRLVVTCSAGVAELSLEDASGQALLRQADAALYAAKRTGRNRVALAGRTSPMEHAIVDAGVESPGSVPLEGTC
jgi:diguanylate cyclase (GGDEF)-like protein